MTRLLALSAFLAVSVASLAHAISVRDKQPPGQQLDAAMQRLKQSSYGRGILANVYRRLNLRDSDEIFAIVKSGEVSKTDAVLTRHYNPDTGVEYRKRSVTVYLRLDQTIDDLVIDMAHEFTHAGSGPNWDPYDSELSAGKYIRAAIEGEGGEADALVSECMVSAELKISVGAAAERCRRYRSSGGLDRTMILFDIYKVGKWKKTLVKDLGLEIEMLPYVTASKPTLFSSTGRAPYPVALLAEFKEITQIACANSRRRLDNMNGRTIASIHGATSIDRQKAEVSAFITNRCQL